MNIRVTLTLIGLTTGWFLFDEMIIGAITFGVLGFAVWFGHKKGHGKGKTKERAR